MPFFSSIVVIVALVTLRKISNSASLIVCLALSFSASTVCPAPNRAKHHFLDRQNIPRMNPESGARFPPRSSDA
jgi:hypothetical protein